MRARKVDSPVSHVATLRIARHALPPSVSAVAVYGAARAAGGATHSPLHQLMLYLVLCGVVFIGAKHLARWSATQLRWDLIRLCPRLLVNAFPPVERSINMRHEDTTPIGVLAARDMFEASHRRPATAIRLSAGGWALVMLSLFIGHAVWSVEGMPSAQAMIGLALATALFTHTLHDMLRLRWRSWRTPWKNASSEQCFGDTIEIDGYSPRRLDTLLPTVPGWLLVLVPFALCYCAWRSSSLSWLDRFGTTSVALALWLGAWQASGREDPFMRRLERVTRPLSELAGRVVVPVWYFCRVVVVAVFVLALLMIGISVTAPPDDQASLEALGEIGVMLFGLDIALVQVVREWRRPTRIKLVSLCELRQEYVGDVLAGRVTGSLRAGLFISAMGSMFSAAFL
jgi:hypothetical protein